MGKTLFEEIMEEDWEFGAVGGKAGSVPGKPQWHRVGRHHQKGQCTDSHDSKKTSIYQLRSNKKRYFRRHMIEENGSGLNSKRK